jgi:DNA-binding MarR family transcriptional regulator
VDPARDPTAGVPTAAARTASDPTDRVTGAIETLFRLEGSRRIHRQQTEAAGVNLPQQALRVLGRLIDAGSTSPGQLATLMDLDPAVVARVVRQLEEVGFVTRRRSADDGRVSTLVATADGRAAFGRIREVIWRHMRTVLGTWDDADIEALGGLLDRLVADVQQVRYRRLDRTAVTRP